MSDFSGDPYPGSFPDDLSTVIEEARQVSEEAKSISGNIPEVSAIPKITGAVQSQSNTMIFVLVGAVVILFLTRKR